MPIPTTVPEAPTADIPSSRLVSADGKVLPLRRTRLSVTAGGGLARTRLVQTFENPHAEPLSVEYLLPLPADGAVAAFAFTIGERRIVGEVDRRQNARERFERAVVRGHTAALLEQDRSSLFRQQVGNVPPGQAVEVEIEVDQPLSWRGEAGEWEFRFPTTVAPRYQGIEGRVADAARQAVDVADGPLPATLELQLSIADRVAPGRAPDSPSHPLRCSEREPVTDVTFAASEVRLDRDVVVRWPAGDQQVRAELTVSRPTLQDGDVADAFGLLTLVPPRAEQAVVARDLVLLLDTSGSMHGQPLAQAIAVARALVDSLGDEDRLQMVEFSNTSRSWQRQPVPATAPNRRAAHDWLRQLRARGGTEMLSGVRSALQPLRAESQTQVAMLTDGLVGFEREITAHLVQAMPAGCRFHVLGVGDSANRSLTRAAARAGRGTEAILGVGEAPERAARHLVAAMERPVVVDLAVDGTAVREVAPNVIPDLFAGSPTRIAVRLDPNGGSVRVRGRTATGTFAQELHVAPVATDDGRRELATLFARERVEDLEVAVAAGCDRHDDLDRQIEQLGLRFAIATRMTSWIAATDEPTVDARQPMRRETMPHELPHGMSVAGLGLRSAIPAMPMAAGEMAVGDACAYVDFEGLQSRSHAAPGAPMPPPPPAKRSRASGLGDAVGGLFDKMFGSSSGQPGWSARIEQRSDGELVLEIRHDGARKTRWRLPSTIELGFDDGTSLRVEVDAQRSTATTRLAAGAIARIVVTMPDGAPANPPSRLCLDGDWIHIG